MKTSARRNFVWLWLLWGAIAAAACASLWPAAHWNDEYLPVTNDSFYHARRILDTAADPSAFYEFDKYIHAPEGSLLTWPWGYDYALGWLVRLAGKAGVPGPPIAFLIWIPVAAVFVSIGLIMLISRRLGLSLWSASIAALCVALSPLTSLLHGAGMIDHHYAEYIFILATVLCGLRWLSNPTDAKAALVLGVVLGLAPAIHNGLFILQLPVLATIFLFWLQGTRLPLRATGIFCATLLVATGAILAPSLPVRLGRFEFYTLSWFHLYIACGTVAIAMLLSYLPKSARNMGLLALAGLVLLLPVARQMLVAESFLAGTIKRLNAIGEVRSLHQMYTSVGGMPNVSSSYSLLIWLLPLIAVYCVFQAWWERNSARLFFWVCALCGMAMLVTQFRLHYYGSFALYVPLLIATEALIAKRPERRRQIMLMMSMGFLLCYALPLRFVLLGPASPPAGDLAFKPLRQVLKTLEKACAAEPGIVLADNDAGHYIRYFTKCSVIANNFLLTPQHEAKIEEIDRLTSLSAAELPAAAPYVSYILLRPVSVTHMDNGQYIYMTFSQTDAPLLDDLLLKPIADVPADYILLDESQMAKANNEGMIPYMRLFKMRRRGSDSATSRIDVDE